MNSDTDKTVTWNSIIPSLLKDGSSHTDDSSSNALPRGMRMGAFEILSVIGEGGFGIVYHAYDHDLERHVALKEYMPAGMASRSRTMVVTVKSQSSIETFGIGLRSFINEARLLAQFDAPSLVKVFQFWEANNTAYMVMPYYKGVTLKQARQAIKASPSEEWLRTFLGNLFDAIEIIHHVNCYHRDIAPDNILLLENNRPLLLDFGAARRVIGDRTQGPTAILKPGFAPIEQYADIPGLKQGPWTDIYALGAVVYYLICGRPPVAAVSRWVEDNLDSVKRFGAGRFSPQFLDAIDRALAVRPDKRIQNIAEFRSALAIVEFVPTTLPPWRPGVDNIPVVDTPKSYIPGTPPTEDSISASPPGTATPPGTPISRRSATGPYRHGPEPILPVGTDDTVRVSQPGLTGHGPTNHPSRSTFTPQEGRQPVIIGKKTAISALVAVLAIGVAAAIHWMPGKEQPSSNPTPPIPGKSLPAPSPPTPAPAPSPIGGPNELISRNVQTPGPNKKQDQGPSPGISPSVPSPKPAPASGEISAGPAGSLGLPDIKAEQAAKEAKQARLKAEEQDKQARMKADEEMWQRTIDANTVDAYNKYLRDYPSGRYVSPAKSAIANLKARDEDLAWNKASAQDNIAAYELFAKIFPNGQHSAAANTRLAELKNRIATTLGTGNIAARDTPGNDKSPKNPMSQQAGPGELPQAPVPPQAKTGESPRESIPPQAKTGEPSRESIPPQAKTGEPPRESIPPQAKTDPSPPSGKLGNKFVKDRDGTHYDGDFEMDSVGNVSGKGRFVLANGERFEGTLVKGVKEGKGEYFWPNGQHYKGDYARGIPNGRGTMEYANGNKYTGEIRDGDATGKGTMVYPSGERYTGEVKNSIPNGHGTMKFASGDTYTGEWRNGVRHGHGRYTWPKGEYWEGEYVNGNQTENGKLVRPTDESGPKASASTSDNGNVSGGDVAQQK